MSTRKDDVKKKEDDVKDKGQCSAADEERAAGGKTILQTLSAKTVAPGREGVTSRDHKSQRPRND